MRSAADSAGRFSHSQLPHSKEEPIIEVQGLWGVRWQVAGRMITLSFIWQGSRVSRPTRCARDGGGACRCHVAQAWCKEQEGDRHIDGGAGDELPRRPGKRCGGTTLTGWIDAEWRRWMERRSTWSTGAWHVLFCLTDSSLLRHDDSMPRIQRMNGAAPRSTLEIHRFVDWHSHILTHTQP